MVGFLGLAAREDFACRWPYVGHLAKWRKDFEAVRVPHVSCFFRGINEGPTLLLVGIAIFVIVQPF
jgi:uncharacterized membrane protein